MSIASTRRNSARWGLALLSTTTVTAAMLAPVPAFAVIETPPSADFEVAVFPQRDFVSAGWNGAGKDLSFELTRGGVTIGTASSNEGFGSPIQTAPPDDAGFSILEVNHPGGLCWANSTPDILPGDVMTITEGPGNGVSWTTLNITADPAEFDPVTGDLLIHGVALNEDGTAMDLSRVEQRIISPGNLFDVNGRRDIRATSDGGSLGSLVANPDVVGGWTATYTGLSSADIDRALAGGVGGHPRHPAGLAGECSVDVGGAQAGVRRDPSADVCRVRVCHERAEARTVRGRADVPPAVDVEQVAGTDDPLLDQAQVHRRAVEVEGHAVDLEVTGQVDERRFGGDVQRGHAGAVARALGDGHHVAGQDVRGRVRPAQPAGVVHLEDVESAVVRARQDRAAGAEV